MKKQFLLYTIFVFLLCDLSAQTRWGVKGGFSVTNWSGPNVDLGTDKTARLLPALSLFSETTLGGSLFLLPDLGYQAKGASFKNYQMVDDLGNDLGSATVKFNIAYLSLHLPLHYRFNESPVSIGAGPYAGIALLGKVKPGNATPGSDENGTLDFKKENMNRADAGLTVGLAIRLNEKWIFDIRYDWGVTKIYKTRVSGNADRKNRAALFTFGYFFH